MPFTTAVLNPAASACTLYTPGFRNGSTKSPVALVLVVVLTFVLALMAVTVTPATTAPD